jgi:hypothetical protein
MTIGIPFHLRTHLASLAARATDGFGLFPKSRFSVSLGAQ